MSRFARVFSGFDAVVSPSASCVAHVRERIPDAPHVFELTEFLIDELGVVDVGASFPHRVTLHPTCHSLRLLGIGDRPRRLLEAVRGIDLVRVGGRTRVLRFRRDVRDQERRYVDGDALGQGPARSGHARGGLHLRRHVVPDAHRRGAVARADRACGRCTWRRSWRRRNELPDRSTRDAGRCPAAAQHRQGHGADPGQARARGRRAARLGGVARRRRGDQGARDGDAAGAVGAARGGGRRGGRRGALGARRRRGERDRGCGCAGARDRRGHQGQVAGHGRDRDERGAGGAGHPCSGDRPGGADRPARAGRQAVAHPGAGDPPQPRGDPVAVRAHDRAGAVAWERGDGDRRGRPAAPALEVPDRARRGLGRELRDRRDRRRRRRRVRGQRAHVPDAAARAGDDHGDREGAALLAGPRGLPAAAAALLDRGADEPVHVAVDRRARW